MGATKLPIDLEDAEGVKRMRALKCTIDVDEGLKNVQQLFIKVFEFQKNLPDEDRGVGDHQMAFQRN